MFTSWLHTELYAGEEFLLQDDGTIFSASPCVFPCFGSEGGVNGSPGRGIWWRRIRREPCVHHNAVHSQFMLLPEQSSPCRVN